MAEDRPTFAREARSIGLVWIALVALMLTSLGSAYLDLGGLNMAAGLVIAAIKAALVVWCFMRLREAGPLVRLVAVTAIGVCAIQAALTGLDYRTRATTAAPLQAPPPTAAGSRDPLR